MAFPVEDFVTSLASQHRVVVIGGLAVIGHGFSRPTKDVDIWLEPKSSVFDWSEALLQIIDESGAKLTLHRLPGWTLINNQKELAEAVDEAGMIRIQGLDCPLDIFRTPNEFDISDFDDVVADAKKNADGTWLPDPLDLIQSKLDTNREKDTLDIAYLEGIIRDHYRKILPSCTSEEAQKLLRRFSDPQVLEIALTNPDPNVQELAKGYLHEFAEQGDPFSQAILEGRELP